MVFQMGKRSTPNIARFLFYSAVLQASSLNTAFFCSRSRGTIEALSTLNNARVGELLIFLFFSKVRSQSKSILGCYIVETAASIASNDARI